MAGPTSEVGLKLASLGCLSGRIPPGEAISALGQLAPEQAAEFFRRHKVRTLADRRIAAVPTAKTPGVRAALSGSVRFIARLLQLVPVVVGTLDRAARELGIDVFGIKGLAAREHYADQAVREIGDWDVYVRSEQSAWALAGWLRNHDFDYDEQELPWFKRELESGRLYGQVRLGRTVHDVKVFIDIHYGGYSVRHCGLLEVRVSPMEPGWHMLDQPQNLVMGVANAAGDQFITVKDINDLMLALDDPSLDWEAVRSGIASVGLQGFFNAMLSRVREIGELSPEATRRAEAVAFEGDSEPLPPIWAPDGRQRERVTVRHAYAQGRRHSLSQGVVAGVTAAKYYGADLSLQVVRRRRRATLPKARPWTCVRLVPTPLATRLSGSGPAPSSLADSSAVVLDKTNVSASGAVRCVQTPAGDLVEAAGELFLPTVYYNISETLARTAAALER